jgi:hypothetical protein
MKIFISYSHYDKEVVQVIANYLTDHDNEVWTDSLKIKQGDNLAKKIDKGIEQAEVILITISKNSLSSEWVQREFSAIAFQQISSDNKIIIPIKLDQSEVPSYLSNRLYLDFSKDINSGLQELLFSIEKIKHKTKETIDEESEKNKNIERYIQTLRDRLRKGRLTLFCGAGVSVGAGIPTWEGLLVKLLESMMSSISEKTSLDVGWKSAKEFLSRNNASSLILGKYLKNYLGKEFAKNVRDSLYIDNPISCPLIESIIDLARPQRDGRPLDSIVTFNFDALIEENLNQVSISNKAIFSEAINHDSNELPIYHVHGFLPRNGNVNEKTELVFSEDAYHSQFIDPFSWSNLIQLNKLTQNTCLFIGISLTDPNMRRLLDVAWRKNPNKSLGHYIIKKIPKSTNGVDSIDKVSKLLEEQDANALGLNVIWIEDFAEISNILKRISEWKLTIASA